MLEDYGWTGQEQDRAAGVSYHTARYLGTGGRWMSSDPLFWTLGKDALERPFEAANPHTYALGNPIGNTDPDGMKTLPDGSIHPITFVPLLGPVIDAQESFGRAIDAGFAGDTPSAISETLWGVSDTLLAVVDALSFDMVSAARNLTEALWKEKAGELQLWIHG